MLNISIMHNLFVNLTTINYNALKPHNGLMAISGINDYDVSKFIDHLVSLSILGRETRPGFFDYEYEFDNDIKIKKLSEKLGSNRYKIHEAFVPYLECKTANSTFDR